MTEKREDSGGSKKMKKMEKPPVVNNREYLDMDTDEEEFGRQGMNARINVSGPTIKYTENAETILFPETPEPEEELEIEPDKPVFTEEELDKLVAKKKKQKS